MQEVVFGGAEGELNDPGNPFQFFCPRLTCFRFLVQFVFKWRDFKAMTGNTCWNHPEFSVVGYSCK